MDLDGQTRSALERAEREIDQAFAANPLTSLNFGQAAWTVLAQNEDAHLKMQRTLSGEHSHIFTDIRLNSLTYPLRACLAACPRTDAVIDDRLIDDHYQAAVDWFELADHHYYNFSSIFPLWHRGKVRLTLEGNRLTATSCAPQDRIYEAYNRLIRLDAKPDVSVPMLPSRIVELVLPNTSKRTDSFRLNFSPRLVSELVSLLEPILRRRQSLPSNWDFDGFRMGDFHTIAATLQAMLTGWFAARGFLVANGMAALGYRSSVWVVSKDELLNRLRRYTHLDRSTIVAVVDILTFGSSGIRTPDIAIQPIVDLGNGHYAFAPFIWLSANVERNLCVLLNQIEAKRRVYARLKNEKEALLVDEIRKYLSTLPLDIRSGSIDGTDVDLALIDRRSKHCLCMELKWFIEPAEIREVSQRTDELLTGVRQAKLVGEMFKRRDQKLLEVLAIDGTYTVCVALASHNWIGHSDAQDSEIPIVKVWHLLGHIASGVSLATAIEWLTSRSYLPREGIEFRVAPIEVQVGQWTCNWYGIEPLKSLDLIY